MLRVFRSIHDAKKEGFTMYDRSPLIFLVRKKNPKSPMGWELAAVQLTADPQKATDANA